ncbi:MAG: PilZ domain-containing protein [Desulfurobacteriaceae bacterium]
MIEAKVGDVVNLYCFYEELLVAGKGTVVEVDESQGLISWEVDEVISKASFLEKRLFFKKEDRWVGADIVFREGNFLSAKILKTIYEPRLRRSFLRVTTSLSSPVEAEVSKLFSSRESTKRYFVFDISEGGIGVLVNKRDRFFKLDENLAVSIYLTLENKVHTLPAKAKVVHISDFEGKKKVGMFLVDISPESRDKILKYITKRQKEIIRGLKF